LGIFFFPLFFSRFSLFQESESFPKLTKLFLFLGDIFPQMDDYDLSSHARITPSTTRGLGRRLGGLR
jgi:hypothetical protein